VPKFTLPINAATVVSGEEAGFGYPVYSNVIGVNVLGISGTTVLVTGTTLADGVTLVHRLEAYDSESLANTRTVELANLPNSLVVAPNGATAYVGSSEGLVVVNLSTFTPSLQTYPIVGGLSTDVVTGQVLGVSPDSRYVLLSDQTNGYVFLIDTTGTKVATRYTIPGINAVTFAADASQFWIGGSSGVYVYTADTFIPISAKTPADAGLSTNVKALAWTPDGQSYFASGDQLVNYSTCYSQNPKTLTGSTTGPINLDATAIEGVPYVIGLAGTQWLNYAVTTSAQVGQTLVPAPEGDICLSTVSVAAPVVTASTLACTARQVTFSPIREQEFITGVDPLCTASDAESVIHGYDVALNKEILLSLLPTTGSVIPFSGGVLNDGRKLYFGTWDSAAGTATLHRIDLAAGTEDFVQQELINPATQLPTTTPPTYVTLVPASVPLVPSFVAVVPK
jgi:hypothetical protein